MAGFAGPLARAVSMDHTKYGTEPALFSWAAGESFLEHTDNTTSVESARIFKELQRERLVAC